MATTTMEKVVARKKSSEPSSASPKRYGTLIRVSDEFAELMRKTCALSGGMSAAEYATARLLPVVQEDYDRLLAEETKASLDRKR